MDGSVASLSSSAGSVKPQSSLNPPSSLNTALTGAAGVYNAGNRKDSKEIESSHAAHEGEAPSDLEKHQIYSLGHTDLEPLNAEESQGQKSKYELLGGEGIEDEGAFPATFELSELKLIEDALEKLRMKSGKNPQLEHEEDAVDKVSGNSERAKQDLEDVGRLLKKVQAVRTQKREAPSRDNRSMSTGGEELDSANIRQAVQTASEVAFTAADAVEKIARVVNKNSAAIERLSKKLESSTSQELHTDGQEDVKEIEDGHATAIDTPADEQLDEHIEITKDVINQNRITHWVLGFMVVSSCIWRFGVYKVGKKVDHTMNNPFEKFTDMFPTDEMGGFKLPFQNSEEEAKKAKKAKQVKSHSSEKEDDNGLFNIGNMWPNGEQANKK